MTILDALTWANNTLPTPTPMLDAQVLLAFVLDRHKAWLFAHAEESLSTQEEETFRQLIERRCLHEPVAYLVGYKAFYGRDFLVTPDVLIPRPETELLINEALRLSKEMPQTIVFADIGTGSGAIAITLAAQTHNIVIASDISVDALEVAKKNALTHTVLERVHLRQGNLLLPILDDVPPKSAHLILCANLPYLTETQWEKTAANVKNFEPKLALTAGADGLDLYRVLFLQIEHYRGRLPYKITLLLEIDPSQSTPIQLLLQKTFPDASIEIKKDLAGRERVVIVQAI